MRFLHSAILLIAALVLIASPGSGQSKKAADFSLKTADGKAVTLKGLAGKVVVVNFWATWCGPCVKEIPGFLEVYDQYRGKGLEIVGVSLDQGGWTKVKPFAEKMKMTYPVVLGDEEVAVAYGATQYIPTTVVVDRKGNVVENHVGFMSKEQFESLVKKYL